MPLPSSLNQGTTGVPNDSRDINPVRSLDDIALSGADLLNQGGVAEGAQTPPLQHGDFRVPSPSGFHVISQTFDPSILASIFVLGWNDVTDSTDGLGQNQIGHYKIYAKLAISNNPNPTFVGEAEGSPAYVSVVTDMASSQVTFFLRPYLTNGQTIPLSDCPTCTGTTPVPFYEFTSGNVSVIIDSHRPVGGATTSGVGVLNNSTGRQLTIAAGFIVAFADLAATKRMWSAGFGGSGQGLIFAMDGTGTGGLTGIGDRVQLDGGQAHIVCVAKNGSGNPALIDLKDDGSGPNVILQNVLDTTGGRAFIGGYLHVVIANAGFGSGNDFFIPLYQ